MLESIKSEIIIKTIFSYESEVRKLKLIRYNKSMQKKFHLEIMNYKRFELEIYYL